MGYYFGLQNHLNKTQLKPRKRFFVFLQAVEVMRIKEILKVPILLSFVERSRFVIALDERICSLNNEEDVLIRKNVKDPVSMVHDSKCLSRWIVTSQLLKKEKHALVLDHHHAECYIADVHCCTGRRQES